MAHDHDHDHDHHPGCDHDHDHGHHHHHDHGDTPIHLQIANALINFANDRIGEGHDPLAVATGMRNASANFTAFAITASASKDLTIEDAAEEFHQLLHYYEERHQENVRPQTPLEQLVDQVRNE